MIWMTKVKHQKQSTDLEDGIWECDGPEELDALLLDGVGKGDGGVFPGGLVGDKDGGDVKHPWLEWRSSDSCSRSHHETS